MYSGQILESKLGSNDRYWFSVVVPGLIFNFLRDIILDSVKNVLPPGKLKKFNFYQVLEDAANPC
jgi:hypothetical protein